MFGEHLCTNNLVDLIALLTYKTLSVWFLNQVRAAFSKALKNTLHFIDQENIETVAINLFSILVAFVFLICNKNLSNNIYFHCL